MGPLGAWRGQRGAGQRSPLLGSPGALSPLPSRQTILTCGLQQVSAASRLVTSVQPCFSAQSQLVMVVAGGWEGPSDQVI